MSIVEQYLFELTAAAKQVLFLAAKAKVKCEVIAKKAWGSTITTRKQELDTLEFINATKVSIAVYNNQHQGRVTIGCLDQNDLEQGFNRALAIAKFTQTDQYAGLADPCYLANQRLDLDLYHPYKISTKDAIEITKTCEQAAFNYSSLIKNSDGATFNHESKVIVVANSHDFIATQQQSMYSLGCNIVAEKSNYMEADLDFSIARSFPDLNKAHIIGSNAAAYAVAKLGAKRLSSRRSNVLFTQAVAADLFSYLIAAISGRNIANHASFLLNQLNQQIFPEWIQIIDHPWIIKGLNSSWFDKDGIATKPQSIIKDGVLTTYLLDNYFAKKLVLTPTGHANGIHNLFINNQEIDFRQTAHIFPENFKPNIPILPENNAVTYEQIWQQRQDLITQMGTGLIVTETIGDGVNLVTGNYSKGAVGFWVEAGKIVHPVHEITIAGNLLDMFRGIVAIGKDYDYRDNIVSGSVLIENMIIGGE